MRRKAMRRSRHLPQAADQIEQLRAAGISVIYDPATKTLRTDVMHAVPASVG